MNSYDPLEADNLLHVKHMSSSTGSLNTSNLGHFKSKKKVVLVNFVNISEERNDGKLEGTTEENRPGRVREDLAVFDSETEMCAGKSQAKACSLQDLNMPLKVRFSRQLSEPGNCSSETVSDDTSENELMRQNSDPVFPVTRRANIEVVFSPRISMPDLKSAKSPKKLEPSSSSLTSKISPEMAMTKFWNNYTAHTSTPAKNLLRKSLAAAAAANECLLTPIANNDKSMSPITQSTTKMSKAMQVCMSSSSYSQSYYRLYLIASAWLIRMSMFCFNEKKEKKKMNES